MSSTRYGRDSLYLSGRGILLCREAPKHVPKGVTVVIVPEPKRTAINQATVDAQGLPPPIRDAFLALLTAQ